MVKNALLRVTQMNAIFFDKEIGNVLWQHAQECFKYLPPGFVAPFEPELRLILSVGTICYSVLTLDRTFGQKLLQIQYDNLNPIKKALYVCGSCFNYFRQRMEDWKPNHDINKTLSNIHSMILIANFVNICTFLRSGKKPQLIERVLNLDQSYECENVQRQFDTKYMTRELLWNGLIEILVYILPLLNYQKLQRTARHLNPFHKKPRISAVTSRNITINTRCPHCQESPVLPHHMGCAHIFCYSCLKGNQIADAKFECPICEFTSPNLICEPVEVQS